MRSKIMAVLLLTMLCNACVQQAYLKTIIVTLTVKGKKGIQTVGIRGNGNPLSWNKDVELRAIIKDSVYAATINVLTAFKFCEAKFTVDGIWELKDQPNRRIVFSEHTDTTYYNAIFDKP